MVSPRPMMTTCLPSTGTLCAREQLDDARGRARQRSGRAHDEPSEVRRVQPVDVLGRVDAQEDLLLVDAVGQRQLHEDRVDRRGRR